MKVLFLTPDLFGVHGGIARHARLCVKALTESPDVSHVDVVALIDAPGQRADPRYVGPRDFTYHAFGGSRKRFSMHVAGALLRQAYDVVITEHVNLAPLMFVTLPGRAQPRRITVMHGIDVWSRLPWLRRRSLQASDVALSVSRFTADIATRENDLHPHKVCVVHNCLDPFFDETEAPAAAHPTDRLLTVSRLLRSESSKGHTSVLNALPQVLNEVPDLTYDIVGDGDLRQDLEALSTRLHLTDHVRFLGNISDAQVRTCYKECTAYVMPSKWEGFGLVFLEAMAYARPVIAGNRDAASEVLGDTAILVDPDDAGAVGDAIRGLLRSRDLQRQLGQAGAARLRERFTYASFAHALMEVLR
jgi:glycosyltransferase involved in cell wall biosynthesis